MLGFSPLFRRLALGTFLIVLTWLAPLAEAHATVYSYNVCINWQIRTTDSSFGIQAGPDINDTEDYYQGCNGTCDVTARGVRIKVAQGAWSSILNTNPTTGCTTFNRTDPPSHTYSITTYAYSTDANGNYVRLHDSPNKIKGDNNDYYPGATISHLQNNLALTPGGGANLIAFGGGGADWTAMAAAAFTLYRYHPGLSNKQIHIASNTAACSLGTAHYSTSTYTGSRYESNSKITSGKHYVKIDTCPTGGTPISRASSLWRTK